MGESIPYRWRGEPTPPHGGPPQDQQRYGGYFRGVAAVPQHHTPPESDTDELPVVQDRPAPPRSHWGTLRRGGGWTMAGLWFAVICWGIWAVFDRDLVAAGYALGLVLATAVLIFTVSRLLGRMVLENTLGRARNSAWASHLSTFLLLVISGLAFLQQTTWVVRAWSWVGERLT